MCEQIEHVDIASRETGLSWGHHMAHHQGVSSQVVQQLQQQQKTRGQAALDTASSPGIQLVDIQSRQSVSCPAGAIPSPVSTAVQLQPVPCCAPHPPRVCCCRHHSHEITAWSHSMNSQHHSGQKVLGNIRMICIFSV